MADRPPWRSGKILKRKTQPILSQGAVRDQSSRNSVTSSYRALNRAPKIGAPKKSRKGRRESKYDFADLAPLRLENEDDGNEFDWGQFGISVSFNFELKINILRIRQRKLQTSRKWKKNLNNSNSQKTSKLPPNSDKKFEI